MKVIALTTAAMFAATTAFAGNMETMAAEPMEMVEMEEAMDHGSAGSMGGLGWLLPLVVIGAIVAAADD